MRIPTLLIALSLLLAGAATAQVPEEIQNAPDAAAYPQADGVVLLDEIEIMLDAEGKVTRRRRELTKIFRDHLIGSGHCDRRLPFDARTQKLDIKRCRGWMRDGTPVDTTPHNGFVEVTPDALQRSVDYTHLREIVAIKFGVQIGGVTELETVLTDQTASGRPFWGELALQSDLPILKQVVRFRVPTGTPLVLQGIHAEIEAEKTTAEGVDTYTVARTNVTPVDLAECGGHARDVVARLVWSAVPSWAEVGTWLDKAVARCVETTPELKARTEALTRGLATPREQAFRLHDFVVNHVRTVRWPLDAFGFTPRPAARVHDSTYGHALDKAVLLKAMLDAAGITSHVVLASPTHTIAMRAASPTQLTDVWVSVEDGKTRIWLDPTASLSRRSARDLEGRAILALAARGATVKRVPVSPAGSHTAILSGVCRIDGKGGVRGSLRLELCGNRNEYHRLRGGEKAVRAFAGLAAATLGGARVSDAELHHFDERRSALSCNVASGRLTPREDGALELGVPDLPQPLARGRYEIYRNRRTTPLFLAGTASERVEVEIVPPTGHRLAYRPAKVEIANAAGRLTIEVVEKDGRLHYRRTFELLKSVVSPEDYAAFRALITAQRARRNTILLFVPEG